MTRLPDGARIGGWSPAAASGMLVLKGPQGVEGPTGPTGPTGATGAAATVAVGTTTTSAPGGNASVTQSGTPQNRTFDFTIPRGATGPKGDTGATGPKGDTGATGATGPPGSGDVTGPASSVGNRAAVFDGTTGKVIKDSGIVLGNAAAADTTDFASSSGGGREKFVNFPSLTGNVNLNCNNGSVFRNNGNLTGAITLNPTNVPTGVAVTLTVLISQAGTARVVNMPSGTTWMGPAPTQAANKKCVITLLTVDGGSTWWATGGVQA